MARLLVALILGLASFSAKADAVALATAFFVAVNFVVANAAVIAFVVFSLYSSSQARKKKRNAQANARAEALANLQDRTANILSTNAPLQVIYGEPAPLGGSIAAVLTSGSYDEYKHVVIVFAAHKITSFDKFYIEGQEVILDAAGNAISGEFGHYRKSNFTDTGFTLTLDADYKSSRTPGLAVGSLIDFEDVPELVGNDPSPAVFGVVKYLGIALDGTPRWQALSGNPSGKPVWYPLNELVSWVRISTHLGDDPDTADAGLRAACPEWTANHKLSGLAYAVVRLHLSHARLQSPAKITAKIKGKPVYDYRTGLTTYSRNPALCTADFLRSYYGFSASAAQIDINNFIYAANVCDSTAEYSAAAVAPGGSYARFTCDGSFTTDQDREAVLTQLEDSFGGNAFRSGGVWRTSPGVYATPIKTLNLAEALAPLQVKQASYSSKAVYNTIRGTFIDKDGLGTPTDYPVYANSTFLSLDGQEKATSKSFVFTGDSRRCRDLARVVVEKSRAGLVVEYPAKFGAWPLQPGDRVWINDPTFGFTNKVMKITDWVQGGDSPLTLQLTEDAAALYDLADEVSIDATPNTDFPNPYLQPTEPSGLVLETGTSQLEVSSDGTIISSSKLSWAASTDPYVLSSTGKVQVRATALTLTAATSYWVDLPGDATTYTFKTLQDKTLYLYEARFVNAVGKESGITGITGVQTGKSEPPPTVAGLTLTMSTIGVLASWTANAELDRDYTYLKRGAAWASATEMGPNDSAVKRDTTTYSLGWLTAGVASVVAKYVDTTGNQSLLAATASITISPPNAVQLTRTDIDANTLSVSWLDAKTSQPILRYEYKIGTTAQTYAQAAAYGSAGADSRSDVIVAKTAGVQRVWFVAVDVAGNVSVPIFLDVAYTLPTDFVLSGRFSLQSNGSGTNTVVNGSRVLMLMTNEVDGTHFSSRGWANDSAAISAGAVKYFQPGTTSASYAEVYDLGAVVAAATTSVSHQVAWLSGAGTIETDIAYKANIGDAWTTVASTSSLLASQVRYIQITVRATATGGDDLVELLTLNTDCGLRRIYESFALTLNAGDVGGTPYVATAGFTDIQGAVANALYPNASGIVRLEPNIDDSGPVKRVLWFGFNGAGVRVGGAVTGQINGV